MGAGDVGYSGQADLVVSAAYAGIDGVPQAGSVTVIYGSADGLDAAGSQLWSRSSPGIADAPGEFDLFGDSLAIGDFGRSSVGDLAISVPFDDPGGNSDAGGVQLLYGTANGLTASGSQYWSQDSRGVHGRAERRDGFGYNLTVADFGRSRRADLAVGVHGENRGAGAVNILYGGSDGLTAAGDQVLSQDTRGIAGVAEQGDQFSLPLAAADLGKNGRAELVIGGGLRECGQR